MGKKINVPKILIAEDEEELRELYTLRLEYESFNVVFASNGEEALDKVEKEKPDLVLLDIMMPKKNGLEVFERIKNNLQDKVDIFLYLRIGQEKILEDFKNSKRALIFGSKNIFKPTDLKVDYLVFMSLPFEAPFHPITVARGKKLKDSFTEYLLLRAQIKFKEIIENFKKISEREAKLPERKTKLPEKRTVFVLDSRIASKEYGLSFIESLKEADISYRKTEDFLKSNSSSKEF